MVCFHPRCMPARINVYLRFYHKYFPNNVISKNYFTNYYCKKIFFGKVWLNFHIEIWPLIWYRYVYHPKKKSHFPVMIGLLKTSSFCAIVLLFFQVKMVNWLNLRSFGSGLVVWLGPYPWLLLTRKRSMAVRRKRGSQLWLPHRNNVASTLSTNRRPRMRNLLHKAKKIKANLLPGGVTSTLFSPIV